MIISLIAKSTGLNNRYISKIIHSANFRYKIYYIPKKKKGVREISHPSSELKLLQKWIVENIFSHFPVHISVYSYRNGIGIQDLAEVHKKNNYLLRIDFTNFFPSVKRSDVSQFLKKHSNLVPFSLSIIDFDFIKNIVCKDNRLTIGAPSSPIITNTILYDFDKLCFEKAKKHKVIYSRYADDIYYSSNSPGTLEKIYEEFQKDLGKLKSPKLIINENKTIFSSRKNKRIVTGLVLTSDKKVSIGRKKKRYIKGLIHHYTEGQLDKKEIAYLRGFLSYIKAVEPRFLTQLINKYGKKLISEIIAADIVQRKIY